MTSSSALTPRCSPTAPLSQELPVRVVPQEVRAVRGAEPGGDQGRGLGGPDPTGRGRVIRQGALRRGQVKRGLILVYCLWWWGGSIHVFAL